MAYSSLIFMSSCYDNDQNFKMVQIRDHYNYIHVLVLFYLPVLIGPAVTDTSDLVDRQHCFQAEVV